MTTTHPPASPTADTLPCGPALAGAAAASWRAVLHPLWEATGGRTAVTLGWDADWERDRLAAAGEDTHLSVRVLADEVLIGPLRVPGTTAGCAGCAETRARVAVTHPLAADLSHATGRAAPRAPLLAALVAPVVAHLAEHPLAPGELYAVSGRGIRRHRVPRHFGCPLCAAPVHDGPQVPPPPPRESRSRPALPGNPGRAAEGAGLLRPDALRRAVVDPRFGPVLALQRELLAPFAMSMAVLPDAIALGYAREATFAASDPIAVLEAYERMSGFPHEAPVLTDTPYTALTDVAIDPADFGTYTEEQAARPGARIALVDEHTPMDWVWGHDLESGRPRLVPAEIGFFQYDYRYRRDQRAARRQGAAPRRHLYQESSSGCALGSSSEEAALHSLLELAERDAFLLSFHRAQPLPEITHASIGDPVSRRLLDLIESRGFAVHLLCATQDLGVPVVWSLAVNGREVFPATFTAAGSGLDPVSAVRAALWELGQIVTDRLDWDRAEAERMLDDPWLVDELDHHIRLYALPERRERATAVLGGPRTTLAEAFPDWPGSVLRAADGDVRGALDHVRGLFAAAGLDRIILVDQTTRDHRDLGLAAAKAVVPGIVPMCFGHAQQRLTGLPRLTAALAGTAYEGARAPYDPHPFP
ncbi:TOMM precursor leader peptide-binding protein [Streptomyces bohaiensis]|uniref:TOMM leader peptide-binding protein n=2 Tax=Streptomyces bohaiensis TaxID=1431344 RepID=A0ABX1C732_9ACTN|nr:TOMM precursor leader peptide-binding protein [Streptomyces bohaiensis]NJQ14036.1 TOMM precursor leader peptide-binding protein [Streptomyces bohaiensis]